MKTGLVVVLVVGLGGTIAGCEVSFFGGDPIVVANTSGARTSGSAASACGDPDDAQIARTTEGGCAERCRIDVEAGTTDCEMVSMGAPRDGVATLDMGSADGVVITLQICDPSGVALQLSDSPTGDADGGDAATTSHDASLLLEGTTLTVRASEGTDVEASTVRGYATTEGCTERTIVLADQLVYLVEQEAGVCGTGMLRIAPPTDEEGTPDSLWYLALAGTVDGARSGSGLRSASFCFW